MRLIRRGKKALGGILLFGILMAGIGSALSGWNFLSRGTVKAFTADSKRAEACISRDGQAILYTSIAAAVTDARANETIYVIPRVNPNNLDFNPIVIDEPIVLGNNKKLVVPYSLSIVNGTVTAAEQGDDRISIESDDPWFADQSEEQIKKNKITEVLIKNGGSITVEAGSELVVQGQLGAVNRNSFPMGQTAGNYGQISMESGSSITIDGSLTVTGYIKPWDESSSGDPNQPVVNVNGSVKLPLVIYDFIGGTNALAGGAASNSDIFNWNGALFNDIFPIETFDMPNVSVPLVLNHGSTASAIYDIYFSGAHTIGEFPFISTSSSDAMFKISSGSITLDYQPAAYYSEGREGNSDYRKRGLTVGDIQYLSSLSSTPSSIEWMNSTHAARTTITLGGNCYAVTGDIVIQISLTFSGSAVRVDVNTAGGNVIKDSEGLEDALGNILGGLAGLIGGIMSRFDYGRLAIPFSYKWDTVIESGSTLDVSKAYMNFLPGSSMEIGPNATLKVSNNGHFAGYTGIDDASRITSAYPLKYADGRDLTDSNITNSGTISVESGAAFAGYVKAGSAGSRISFGDGTSRSVSTNELNWKTSDWTFQPKTHSSFTDVTYGPGFVPEIRKNITSTSFSEISSIDDGTNGILYEIPNGIVRVDIDATNLPDGWDVSYDIGRKVDDDSYDIAIGTRITISGLDGIGYAKVGNDYYVPDQNGSVSIYPNAQTNVMFEKREPLDKSTVRVSTNGRWSAAFGIGLDDLKFEISLDNGTWSRTVTYEKASGSWGTKYIEYDHTFTNSGDGLPTIYIGSIFTFVLESEATGVTAENGAVKLEDLRFLVIGEEPVFYFTH